MNEMMWTKLFNEDEFERYAQFYTVLSQAEAISMVLASFTAN